MAVLEKKLAEDKAEHLSQVMEQVSTAVQHTVNGRLDAFETEVQRRLLVATASMARPDAKQGVAHTTIRDAPDAQPVRCDQSFKGADHNCKSLQLRLPANQLGTRCGERDGVRRVGIEARCGCWQCCTRCCP